MQRDFSLQRGQIDLETGEFPLTLFTNGEASDGHIIDIRGLEVPELVPMFVNHNADPTQRMGSLSRAKKTGHQTQLGGGRLRMVGRIDLVGDSLAADIRRDVAQGISVGDVTGMSGRWDAIGAPVARSTLAKGHYAHSNAGADGFNTPMFFETSRVLEGSIVGIGADSAALMGRSHDLQRPEHIRDFYRVMVEGDPLTREQALTCLFAQAENIEGLEQIETDSGAFFVPADIAADLVHALLPDNLVDALGCGDPRIADIEEESEALENLKREPETDAKLNREEAGREPMHERPEPSTAFALEIHAAAPSKVAAVYREETDRSEVLLQRELVAVRYQISGRIQ